MPTNTTKQIALSLVLDGTEVNCQLIDVSYTAPGNTVGETVEVACPDGVVTEPGDTQSGSLTGTLYTDTTDSGASWLLMQAQNTDAALTYEVTWFADLDETVAFTLTGTAKVASFQMDWSKPGFSRHPLDLELLYPVAIGRPTP
jgi:hypothetical protein